ncbi:MAG: alkaline phosphatase family protein [Muribaculaceae bacterium]|nr:alkaline phosphatase family protein [Muribaculaceae bacterium]MDE6795729.1 alkaline phosphatase family protein [Muribaculaceae bacterium]
MNRFLTSVICGLVGINTMLAADPSRPKLVVGIVVDQLRTDYIEYLQNLFGEKGFRKLMKEGAFLRNVDYKVGSLDKASATAMVYTGAYPRQTGVAAASVYDPTTQQMAPALHDSKVIGNFTEENLSPTALRLSTISDEIAIDGVGVASVYSIAPDAQQAIIMAGHAGNSAFWINDNTGRWATTTYYRDTPKVVTQRNYDHSIASRIDTMQWRPSLPLSRYPGLPSQKKMYDFKHTFSMADRNVYRQYASSPLVNTEVTDVAISYLKDLKIGTNGEAIDMLNIGYTAAPYKAVKDGDFRLELEDSYVRLDGQLGRLFDAIDKYVGLDNTFVYVTSTGYYDDAVVDDPKYRIPTGEFSVKRALSLLNSYLTAKYGNGNYVDTYSRGHVYLDRKEIESKQLRLDEVAQAARDFLVKMSGVSDAYTMGDIMTSALPGMEALRLGTDPKTGGDVVLEFNSGWRVKDDTRFPEEVQVMRSSMVLSPAFFMGSGVKPQIISTPVEVTAIAPTVTQTLRIRAPSGAISKPLPLE